MSQNSQNKKTPTTSEELNTKLEPGHCCICQQSLRSLFLISPQDSKSYFNYFYLTTKNDNNGPNKYIALVCNNCLSNQIKLQRQFSSIYANYLQEQRFWINQFNRKRQAKPEEFDFCFSNGKNQAAVGYLTNQTKLCENCTKLEEQIDAFEKIFIQQASSTPYKALEFARLLAIEEYEKDKLLYNQYLYKYRIITDDKEKFYLRMKLQKLQERYKKKGLPKMCLNDFIKTFNKN